YHVGALLADHDRRRIGVAGDDRRHDRSIGDTQIADTMDAKLRVDHGVDFPTHAAGADGMQVGNASGAYVGLEVRFAGDVGAGQDFLDDERFERRLSRDLSADAHAFDQRLEIVGALQEVEANLGRGERIGRLQSHRATSVRFKVNGAEAKGGEGLRYDAVAV